MNCDFSIRHYREILQTALASGYQFIGFNATGPAAATGLRCVLRHDVDYMPEWTLRIGEIEHALGIRSTYFFQIAAKTYNLRESATWRAVQQLQAWGHTIGLHFDPTWNANATWDDLPALCDADKALFTAITGITPCEMISFHNTHIYADRILNTAIPGLRHAYEAPYFSDMKYLSDSQGWYEGCVCHLFKKRTYPALQLLTHADYWFEQTTGDFISDIAGLIAHRSEELRQYFVTYHPVCRANEARLIDEVRRRQR